MLVKIRPYECEDCAACRSVLFQSVRDGAAKYYTPEQRAAWAPDDAATPEFCARLAAQQVFVATEDDEIIGFISLTQQGYLDLAFVLPRWMGRAVAQNLYDVLTQWARDHGLNHLDVDASHFARSFFARNGWTVDHIETVTKGGQNFESFAMSIDIETIK